ncbi:MAG TPA: acyl-homoserine-lactone synthase [Sphingomonas sp.]|nr:acyl-homoserine-lactone synthase [Sphingomonas sp.]
MLLTVDASNRIGERVALRAMFAARKRVFVDLLKWDIPVLDGRYEIDQFDDGHARYIVLVDEGHHHLASARLLPTTRPGILNSLYLDLCDAPPPAGDRVFEITRFCLSPDISAADRRICRNRLVTALALYALDQGIETYTGVAELGWLRQILTFGWDCRLLGLPQVHGNMTLGALRIDIASDTLARLETAGIAELEDQYPARQAA